MQSSSTTCHYQLNNFFSFTLPFFAICPEEPNTSTGPIIVDITDNIELDQLRQKVENLGYREVIYITSNIAESNGNDIVYFPSWLYSCSLKYSKLSRVRTDRKRSYKISCLNRNCTPHKLYTYLQLLTKPYFSECVVSFSNQFCIDAVLTPLDLTSSPFNELPQWVIDQAQSVSLYREVDHWNNDHSFLHTAFTDCYLNITTETRAKWSLFTEKTAKPLAAGQLFLQVNGPDSLKGLQTLGIEVFDNIFDIQYDSKAAYTDRIDAMFLQLDTVVDNLEEIYHSNTTTVQYNQDYFLSDAFRQRMEKNLRDRELIL